MKPRKTNALSRLRRALGRFAAQRHAQIFFLPSVFFNLTSAMAAEGTRPAYTPPPPAVSSGSILQIIFSLLLVLAVIVLVAWLLKRMNAGQHGSGNLLKVVGGIAVGQRERVVLVEVQDTWLVVGVGPGQIRTLHTLQKPASVNRNAEDPALSPQAADNKFASLLASVLRHQSPDRKRNAP
ncbi:MAG: flagellar biosynthetic protein FliO [Nitrosomonadales bacterium]|nr:flagellar biosynthetic protein FliO [Nitrosomonadales bacterium]